MATRKDLFSAWLAFFSDMSGLALPAVGTAHEQHQFYKKLALFLHPDKQPTTEPGHQARCERLFKMLSDVYTTYTQTADALQSPPSADDTSVKPEDDRHKKRVHLVTFSHSQSADRRSPAEFGRREFGELLMKAFEASVSALKVVYLAVFQETHADGHPHFHVAIKSSKSHRWGAIAQYLRHQGVFVHFSDAGAGYSSAFRYGWWPTRSKPMAMLDKNFVLIDGSEPHPAPAVASTPPLFSSRGKRPSREPSVNAAEDDAEGQAEGAPEHNEEDEAGSNSKKARREPVFTRAFRIIRDHGLRTADQLAAFVNRCDDQRLVALIMQRNPTNLVEKVWQIVEAETRLKRQQQSRLDLLRAAADGQCSCRSPRFGDWGEQGRQRLSVRNDVLRKVLDPRSVEDNFFVSPDPTPPHWVSIAIPYHQGGAPLAGLPPSSGRRPALEPAVAVVRGDGDHNPSATQRVSLGRSGLHRHSARLPDVSGKASSPRRGRA